MHLGLGHMHLPIRLHSPSAPRFLLTGPAGARLFRVREFLRNHADRDNAVAEFDLDTARWMLYPSLDFPTPPYMSPGRDLPPGLLEVQAVDAPARTLLCRKIREWIRRRRARRAREWVIYLQAADIVPDGILALPHVLLCIGESL